MFRRKEDGSDSIDTTTDTDAPISFGGTSGTPASTASTPTTPAASSPMNATTPATPTATAPAAQPAPAFRPAAPAAAIAAANRTAPAAAPLAPATPAAPQAAATATAPTPAPAERMPAAPLARPASKRVLTVGPEIQMKGEVTSCDRVIIEGTVDATMRDVHTVELAESGSLKGTAEVEDAEISGSFEGDLVVRGRLTVYSSGRVRGNVTYGEIEIQRGGQISGNIRNVADAKAAAASGQQAAKKAA